MAASLYRFMLNADELDLDMNEIYRYMGAKSGCADAVTEHAAQEALREVILGSRPSAVYAVNDIFFGETGLIDLGFGRFFSRDLSKCLSECEKAIVFAATIGIHTDRLVARYEAISPLKALASNSAGTALIEAFCDCLCENLNERFNELGFESRPRFSAGYGDFPLQCQIELLKMLKADKLLGITLNDSLLMTPAKSVTAVIGLKKA